MIERVDWRWRGVFGGVRLASETFESWDVCVVSATGGLSGRVGMVGGIDTQASYVGARDRDPATTHRSLEKAVGEANRCDVDCTSGLSCLASGQP